MSTSEQVGNNPKGIGGFVKGQSGNPGGRPKNSLKSYVAKKLAEMSDEQKEEFLKSIQPDFIWKMGEGNPHSTSDEKVEVTLPKPIYGGDNSKKE